MSETAGALAGLRVLDISSFLAAPQVATFLGDFGADVIKVEPPSGEALRRIGASRKGESLVWGHGVPQQAGHHLRPEPARWPRRPPPIGG